jgi:hypothetical protein
MRVLLQYKKEKPCRDDVTECYVISVQDADLLAESTADNCLVSSYSSHTTLYEGGVGIGRVVLIIHDAPMVVADKPIPTEEARVAGVYQNTGNLHIHVGSINGYTSLSHCFRDFGLGSYSIAFNAGSVIEAVDFGGVLKGCRYFLVGGLGLDASSEKKCHGKNRENAHACTPLVNKVTYYL